MIVLDAFSSDSIPVHLLTEEAMRTYVDRLAPAVCWWCTSATGCSISSLFSPARRSGSGFTR